MGRGFTLIELLAVIAIITILAAILFPVFARTREKARQTNCASNCEQLAMAVLMYAEDYGETFPRWPVLAAAPGAATPVRAWYPLEPYVRNADIYTCPSGQYYDCGGWCAGLFTGSSYGYNCNNGNPDGGLTYKADLLSGEYRGRGLAEITYPAETVMLQDSYCPSLNGGTLSSMTPADGRYGYVYRHNDGANIAWADGHVKWESKVQAAWYDGIRR